MTPPASPCSSSAGVNRSNHSGAAQLQLPSVPSAAAAALVKAQTNHSWKPEEAGRLADQAWQDSLLLPSGLAPRQLDTASTTTATVAAATTTTTATAATAATTTTVATIAADDKEPSNLWDFVDATAKTSCICTKYVSLFVFYSILDLVVLIISKWD